MIDFQNKAVFKLVPVKKPEANFTEVAPLLIAHTHHFATSLCLQTSELSQ